LSFTVIVKLRLRVYSSLGHALLANGVAAEQAVPDFLLLLEGNNLAGLALRLFNELFLFDRTS
jgi:hypothetical protein